MKHILTILTFFVWSYTTLASDTTIVFRQVNYADLFELAKKENKGVMLYFHFDGCGACVTMERTAFKDKNVFEYFNSNFINFEINTLKGEGLEINKLYNVKLHPTFLFFDNKGIELHKMVGVFSPEEFYKQTKNALLSNKNLTNYKRLYNLGNKQPDFLFDYTYMLRDANELDSLVINEYLNTQTESELSKEKNIRFIYEFIINRGKVCISFNSTAYLYILNNKNKFAKFFDLEQVNTRLMFVVQSAVYNSIERKDATEFLNTIDALKEYDIGKEYNFKEMDSRITMWTTGKTLVLSAMLHYYEKIGDKSNYLKTLDTYILKIWDDADELNNFAWGVYEQSQVNETEKIQVAIKCSVRSIELNNNYANNDTFSWLLYKSGENKKALKQAQKSIEIAKKNNQNYSETQKLIDIISSKK
jgi:thioredoxin-related protein